MNNITPKNPNELETQKFKQLLDLLPYLSIGEKIIACTFYFISDTQKRLEMVQFYNDQQEQHVAAYAQYQQKLSEAKKKLSEKATT